MSVAMPFPFKTHVCCECFVNGINHRAVNLNCIVIRTYTVILKFRAGPDDE